MRPLKGSLWCCALAALAFADKPASAAWNNVFQVCCHSCQSQAYYAAPPVAAAPAPAPCGGCQQCTTRYIQRCYYQPVTTYQQSCYMEPVTTYRTSYYYEPCTSYRYSCSYDPCTCSYQQVACPVTTYRLRSQCCPVTSYLQRCCLKPVTTYQQMTYYQPVTTCCQTTIGAPIAAPCAPSVAPVAPPGVQSVPGGVPPGVQSVPGAMPPAVSSQPNGGYGAPPAVSSQPNPGGYGTSEPPPPGQAVPGASFNSNSNAFRAPRMPSASDGSFSRQPQLQAPVPTGPSAPATAPRVRFDRITAAPRHNTEGQVVRADRLPQSRAKVVFVCADDKGGREAVTTDDWGRFRVNLASGNWLIYTQDATGRLVYQQKVQVGADKTTTPIVLVSR
jgi:hypothetical protein